MNKLPIQILIIISVFTFCIPVIRLLNIFNLSGSEITHRRVKEKINISFVPLAINGIIKDY